jgi:hypothetical protein
MCLREILKRLGVTRKLSDAWKRAPQRLDVLVSEAEVKRMKHSTVVSLVKLTLG